MFYIKNKSLISVRIFDLKIQKLDFINTKFIKQIKNTILVFFFLKK